MFIGLFIADVAPIGKIKVLRTDGGGEYMSNFRDVLMVSNINSALHTPPSKTVLQKGVDVPDLTWQDASYCKVVYLSICGIML